MTRLERPAQAPTSTNTDTRKKAGQKARKKAELNIQKVAVWVGYLARQQIAAGERKPVNDTAFRQLLGIQRLVNRIVEAEREKRKVIQALQAERPLAEEGGTSVRAFRGGLPSLGKRR